MLGLHASTLSREDAAALIGRVAGAVRHVSITGLSLLLFSGIALTLVGGASTWQTGGWWFRAKLVFAAIVVVAFVPAQVNQARAGRGDNAAAAARRAMWSGRLALAAAVVATVLAVLAVER